MFNQKGTAKKKNLVTKKDQVAGCQLQCNLTRTGDVDVATEELTDGDGAVE